MTVRTLLCPLVICSLFYCFIPTLTELEAGFLKPDYILEEGEYVRVCVQLEGKTERAIDDIEVKGEY